MAEQIDVTNGLFLRKHEVIVRQPKWIICLFFRLARCLYGHFKVDGMPKIRAICRKKALILTIPMYCVKKSNLGKIREKMRYL